MLTYNNSGAVVFSLQLRCGRTGCLATLKTVFVNGSWGGEMNLCSMPAQRNTGAVGFAAQLADERMHYLVTEKLFFANCFVIGSCHDEMELGFMLARAIAGQ